MNQPNRPKIGLALSGCSGRAIGHVAILEVFKEQGIPVDIVVGCSSGALVTASYGVGRLPYIKNLLMTVSKKRLYELWSIRGSIGGLVNFRNAAAKNEFYQLTLGKRFEELPVKIGFTASDIETGELLTIASGDLTQALRATIAVPGLFEPMIIDGRILVDGGLVNIVPTVPVRQMGADIVIGVDLALTKFLYQKKLYIWRVIRRVRRMLGIHFIQHSIIMPITSKIIAQLSSSEVKPKKVPNMFRILAWAVDHSFDVEKEWDEENRSCDLMISPNVRQTEKTFISKFSGINMMQTVYDESRKEALLAVPKIKKLIEEYNQAQKQPVMESVKHD